MNDLLVKIDPKAKDLGDDFFVRRSLPFHSKRMVGPFIFWDHMGPVELSPEKELKVRSHPHIGISTITYLFDGEIMHRDSLGNEQMIRPGEVNWMTAGSGITHSERSNPKSPMQLEGIQLWVALPKENEEVEPNFHHEKENALPLIDQNGVSLRLIAGEALGHKSPLPVYSDLFYLSAKATQGSILDFPVKPDQDVAVYVIKGKLKSDLDEFSRYQMGIFNKGSHLKLNAAEDTEFMVLGGTEFPEKRHIWWNFVSSDSQKIEQAKKRWTEGGFAKTINETETIPLPKE